MTIFDGLIYLAAYQLLMGYLIPKIDSFDFNPKYIFNVSLHYFKLHFFFIWL